MLKCTDKRFSHGTFVPEPLYDASHLSSVQSHSTCYDYLISYLCSHHGSSLMHSLRVIKELEEKALVIRKGIIEIMAEGKKDI